TAAVTAARRVVTGAGTSRSGARPDSRRGIRAAAQRPISRRGRTPLTLRPPLKDDTRSGRTTRMRLSRPALAFVTSGALFAAAAAARAQDKPEKPPEPDAEAPVRLLPKDGGWKIDELFDQIHK